jgi:hypothetical protein
VALQIKKIPILKGASQSLALAIVLGTDNDVDQATTYVWDETEGSYFGFQRYTVDGLKVNKENTVPVSSYGGYYKDIQLKAEFTDPFQLVQVQVNSPSGPYGNAIPGVKQLPVPAFYLCWQVKQQNWEDQMAAFRFLMNVFALTTGTSEIAAAKGVMKIWRVSQIVVPITTEILNYPSIQDKIAQYDGGEEFLALLNRADMLVGVISVGEVAAILPEYAKNLVNAWKRVKNSANKTTGAKIADDLAGQYEKVDNLVGGLDETVEVVDNIGKYDWALVRKYFNYIQDVTGRPIPQVQIEKLKDALRAKEYKLISKTELDAHRLDFNKRKSPPTAASLQLVA